MLSALALGIRFFHIADDGLPTVIDADVLDANVCRSLLLHFARPAVVGTIHDELGFKNTP